MPRKLLQICIPKGDEVVTLSELMKGQKPALLIGNGINRHNSRDSSWDQLLDQIAKQQGLKLTKEERQEMSNTEFFDILDLAKPSEDRSSLQAQFCNLMSGWKPAAHHTNIVRWAHRHHRPIVTVNFDENLSRAMDTDFYRTRGSFTDFYPWRSYFSDREIADPRSSFAIWHAHGMMKYPRSIRLGLTHYMGSVQRARSWVFNSGGLRGVVKQAGTEWRGSDTWLEVLFFSPLLIIGFTFGKDETFLRWLFLERARLHKIAPERKAKTWYVCGESGDSQHRRLFFERIGMNFATLPKYADIYEAPFWEQ
jgi:hypothetical protein